MCPIWSIKLNIRERRLGDNSINSPSSNDNIEELGKNILPRPKKSISTWHVKFAKQSDNWDNATGDSKRMLLSWAAMSSLETKLITQL